MIDDKSNNASSILAAGMAMAEPKIITVGGTEDFLCQMVPPGASMKVESIEKFRHRPYRKRGTYNFTDAKSFIAFVNREKTPETFILANRENPAFTAVFNGNEAEADRKVAESPVEGGPSVTHAAQAGWGDYRASYACPYSPEWKVWTEKNKARMSQHDFAVFMEDNFVDVVQPAPTFDPHYTNWPDGQELLRLALGMEGKSEVAWGSALRLDNGQVRFKYDETISGQIQGNYIDVPQKFAVGIPVFAGTAPWQIVAKLRWRIEKGGLLLWYEFERIFKITERAFDEARAEIATGTGVPIYLGAKQSQHG